MKYLLDTNICIYLIKEKPEAVIHRFESTQVGQIGISSISVAELYYGVEKSGQIRTNKRALEQFLLPLMILDFDYQAAMTYGLVRRTLESKGHSIGPLDTIIAAHALTLNATLVTNNEREFSRVDGLRLENWAMG